MLFFKKLTFALIFALVLSIGNKIVLDEDNYS